MNRKTNPPSVTIAVWLFIAAYSMMLMSLGVACANLTGSANWSIVVCGMLTAVMLFVASLVAAHQCIKDEDRQFLEEEMVAQRTREAFAVNRHLN